MGGSLQHRWRHCVPKSRRVSGARINLTFRLIHPVS
jgi:alkylated DNA repair dioxygenase AlkB